MPKTLRNISEKWAYDIDKNPIDQGEIWDVDCINQSIEMILGTMPGERLLILHLDMVYNIRFLI